MPKSRHAVTGTMALAAAKGTMNFIVTAIAAAIWVILGMCFDISPGQASYFGDAQWCVVTFGDDVKWDCEYRSSQECIDALASGIRGGCNVNPYWRGPSTPAAGAQPKHRKRFAKPR